MSNNKITIINEENATPEYITAVETAVALLEIQNPDKIVTITINDKDGKETITTNVRTTSIGPVV